MEFKAGQVWADMGSEYLIIEVLHTKRVVVRWYFDGSISTFNFSSCENDIFVREVSSLEKELL